ncbi:MAG: mannonate dehydratase [Balneolaceae bacterium]
MSLKFEETWRWYGPKDSISLEDIRQTGATGIVTALHHLSNGEVWSREEIAKRKADVESAGLRWSVVESIPVHEEIKQQSGSFKTWIENYKTSIRNLGACGIDTVCYNFMPILDWTRTDLKHPMPDGSTGLRYDASAVAAFDLFLLNRPGAGERYSPAQVEAAKKWLEDHDEEDQDTLIRTVIAGLPGAEEGYTIEEFQQRLDRYRKIGDRELRHHLYHFLREIVPVAEESGVRLAIHPDDPPFPLFGLPRVVSTEADANQLLAAAPSPANGLTFCTGSYGVRSDNDLPGMVKRLGPHIHFVHLRSVQREADGSFHEANHLEGSAGMRDVMAALIREQNRREKEGRTDLRMPFRPDHGHAMLVDRDSHTQPGYTCIGRMRGLAELRGLEEGLRYQIGG